MASALSQIFIKRAKPQAAGRPPKKNRMDLARLWVLPGWMARGVGRLLFGHAAERTAALGFRELEIESDPNAEGFHLKLGARRVTAHGHAIGENQRELPVLVYEIRSAV